MAQICGMSKASVRCSLMYSMMEIIVKVVSMDVLSGKVIDVLGIYRFEELVELLTKLI